ncbi:MAG: IS5 family transposase [Planctomycetota bacterium]
MGAGRRGVGRRRVGRGDQGIATRLDQHQGPPDGIDRATDARRKKDDADARRCLGRSRGGRTTKRHAAVDGEGRLRRPVLAAGQRGDAPQAEALLEGQHADHVLADAAYDRDAIRKTIRKMKAKACIKPNPTRKRKKRYDRQRYRHRHVIERFFRRIKQCRRVATRYEKKPDNFAAFLWLAAGLVGAT